MANARMKYFIRVTNVELFNALVDAAEEKSGDYNARIAADRTQGYYQLSTDSASLWQTLYLYGQMLAQAQDEFIDGGENLKL